MKNNQDQFNGFTINLYLDEQQEWLAYFVEMPNISAFADTPQQAIEELEIAWKLVKEDYEIKGENLPIPQKQEFNQRLNIKIDQNLHQSLILEANQKGISLNSLLCEKLAKN